MERTILHIDINHCYAQIEEMLRPELKKVPMIVGGYEEDRHGIMLAKNLLAKQYGLNTGETLREIIKKCPDITILPPHYDAYVYYTNMVKDIYKDYSDQVESFGLDEAWIDVTHSRLLYGSGEQIAKIIQQRVFNEIGLTVSIGISYNKILAKLASDLIKPSGFIVITKHDLEKLVWKLPVEDLLYVGQATKTKLNTWGIYTIGDLAKTKRMDIKNKLGKWGEYLWLFANGEDHDEVSLDGYIDPIKSIGNSITTRKDILTLQQAKHVFYVLCESVASRLRDAKLCGTTLAIHLRTTTLSSFSRQCKVAPTNTCEDMISEVMPLLHRHYDFHQPLRSIGVSMSALCLETTLVQDDIFGTLAHKKKIMTIEKTMDRIRNKEGFSSIKRCSLLLDEEITDFDPKGEHTIFPVSYF